MLESLPVVQCPDIYTSPEQGVLIHLSHQENSRVVMARSLVPKFLPVVQCPDNYTSPELVSSIPLSPEVPARDSLRWSLVLDSLSIL